MSRSKTPSPYPDAAWIVALWRALHGGDPSPEEIAADVIAGFSQYLPLSEHSFLSRELLPPTSPDFASYFTPSSEELDEESIESEKIEGTFDPEKCEYSIRHYYFKFKGHWYCLGLPALAHSPTAA
jgi:hypothetical protein